MHLKPQESADEVGEEISEDGYAQNRERALLSWCCSLERRNVRRVTD